MKKSVLRLITICAALALLCAATLCFSLPSAAENLLTDTWAALDGSQSAYVSYAGGVLSIDAVTPGVDVKAYQTLNLGAGSYKLSVTKSSNDLSFTVQYPGGEASEVKYEEGYVDFTMASAGEVTIIAYQYRQTSGTASNMTLVSVGGSSETSQGGQVVTEPVVTQPQGGSELTGNWVAMDAGQASLVTYSNGTLTLDASAGTDVKASQTLNLAAGSYRFSATKSGEPAPDLMVRTAAGDVPEGKYEEAGHVDFTLASAGEVTLIVSEYRGGIGTLTNLVLSGGGSQPTSIVTDPVSSETQPVVTQPVVTQPQGGSELTGNWVAMDAGQASLVSYSNGTLTLDASAGTDVKASQTLNLAAGSYRFSATKSGEPAPDLMVRTAAGDVPEGKYEEAGHVDFTLASAGEVTLIVSEYRGGIGTLTNLVLSGGGSQPTSIVTDPVSSETQPVVTQPQGGSELTGNWTAMDASQASLVSYSNGTLTLDASGGVDVKASQTLTLSAGSYRFSATKSGEPSPDLMVRTASGDVPEGKYEEAGHVDFTLASAGEVTLIVSEYRGGIGTLTNLALSGSGSPIVTNPTGVNPTGVNPTSVNPTSVNPGQTGKVVVWSGTIARQFTTKNTVAIISVDELTQAFRSDLAANGVPTKYEIEAVATYDNGPSGYASWGFYQDAPYLELWSDKGSELNKATISDAKSLASLTNGANVCLFSDGSGDAVTVQSLTLYAYREGGTTNPSSIVTNPTSVNPTGTPGQVNKVAVWSGNIGRDFTSKNTVAIVNVDELTQAFRNDIATNGIPVKYEIEAVASYTSGPSGYACWGFYQDAPYLEAWSDKGGTLNSSVFTNAADLSKLTNSASVCLFSEGSGDITSVQSLTLYAYREGGTVVTDPTQPIVTDPIVTDPTQPTDGKVLVWAGNLNADYTTVNGVAAINDQTMMMAVIGELMTNGIPEQVEVKSALTYLGGDSGFAAIGLYSNGQVIWPDDGCPIDDVTFSNLQGLGADTALVVFSYGTDTVHIDNMEIYVKRATPVVTDPSSSGSEEVVPGDANGDGAINMKDVLALRKLLADMPTGDFNETNADVNGDGSVNMKDVLALRKMLAN